jgi:hypothetical protein
MCEQYVKRGKNDGRGMSMDKIQVFQKLLDGTALELFKQACQ